MYSHSDDLGVLQSDFPIGICRGFARAPWARFCWPIIGTLPVLVFFALGLRHLGAQSFWYDEAASTWLAQRTPLEQIGWLADSDAHPPLYSWILHYWMGMVGRSEFALRWLSLACATIALAIVVRVLIRVIGRRRTAPLALLLGTNPFVLYYGQEARMYALVLLWSAASLWLFTRLVDGDWRWRVAIAYATVAVAGLYTHYYFVFLLVGEGAVFLIYYHLLSSPATTPAPLRIT